MTKTNWLQKAEKCNLEPSRPFDNIEQIKRESIPFSGSLIRHPYDDNKALLVVDPYSPNTIYYEFKKSDIFFLEKLTNMTSIDGETITMTRIWVRKNTIAIRSSPFLVTDSLNF